MQKPPVFRRFLLFSFKVEMNDAGKDKSGKEDGILQETGYWDHECQHAEEK